MDCGIRVVRYAYVTKQVGLLLAAALVVTSMFAQCVIVEALAPNVPEYEKFVHTYMGSESANWTSMEKPMFPVYFNESQIAIGGNWSIVEPLVANQSYHVYCYGAWVNNGSNPQTNYDLYVYNPNGLLESGHTRAAGLAEQLSTTTNASDIYFVPKTSGNYTFVVINNAGSSNGTEAATFMTIENINTNTWYTRHIEGRNFDSSTKFSTSWAYEFVTESQQIEVYLKVPDTLDMYEARLYVMSDPQSLVLNGSPLPWEQGLYGNTSEVVGGYSLDSNQYRGVAYASCEYRGQDMTINYSNPTAGKTLYQIVLIGEAGVGNVEFLIKTQFGDASLTVLEQVGRIYPTNQTMITCVSNSTVLEKAVLVYSTDKWNSTTKLDMNITKMNCTATIPTQKAGTTVQYKVTANDVLMNTLQTEGNFTVKRSATLNITALQNTIRVGENATITGLIIGQNSTTQIKIQFMSALTTEIAEVTTLPDGSFTANFPTNSSGTFAVQASFFGGDTTYSAESNQLSIKVLEPTFFAKNGLFIGGGFFGAVGIIGLVLFIKKRRQ